MKYLILIITLPLLYSCTLLERTEAEPIEEPKTEIPVIVEPWETHD